jgi:hypothetical protein
MAINAKDVIAAMPEADQRAAKKLAETIIAREYSSPGESVEFEFTLILDGVFQLTPEVMDAFDAAGCTDALLSRRDGVVSMDFVRAAPTMQDAVTSAIREVEGAGIDARVERFIPNTAAPDAGIVRLSESVNAALSIPSAVRADPMFFKVISSLQPATPQ